MDRRSLLSAGLVIVSGCLSSVNRIAEGGNAQNKGLRATFEGYFVANKVAIPIMTGRRTSTPPNGAVYLMVSLKVENVGQNQREFPEFTGRHGPNSDIFATYNGEPLERVDFGAPEGRLIIKGNKYRSYSYASYLADKDGAFPGESARGLVPFIIPEGFSPSDVIFKVKLQGREFSWTLDPPVETLTKNSSIQL